jgi:hypothetical protein
MSFRRIPRGAGTLVVVIPLLVLTFDLRNKFPVQIILVDLSKVSVHLDPNRGKTTNWMRRVNGAELPISIRVDPIIRRPANPQTWAQKLEVLFRQFNAPQHPQYISRVMKTLLQVPPGRIKTIRGNNADRGSGSFALQSPAR